MELNQSKKPLDHMHDLLDTFSPSMRWDGSKSFSEWQKEGREKLSRLLGLSEIEPCRTEPDLKIEYDRINREEGFREIRFHFSPEKNVSLPCHLLKPLGTDSPLPVMICLQGHSTGMHISLGRPMTHGSAPVRVDGDRDFAVRVIKEGYCALVMDQRCFGEASDIAFQCTCREPAIRAILLGRTLIGERVWDVMRLIDLLETDFSDIVDTEKIMMVGNSGGGTATTYTAAMDSRVKVAIPSCAVCRFADSIGAMLHCECNYVPGIAVDFDMGELAGMIAPNYLIVVSGAKDEIFPIDGAKACMEEAKKIYAAAGVTDRITHVIGPEDHRFYADAAWSAFHSMITEW